MPHFSSFFHRCPISRLPEDGLPVIVSFPKAGRTWLRVMLDEMGIPAHYEHDRTSHKKKAHWKTLSPNKSPYAKRKIVFLARDPRDTVVSGFFQVTLREKKFEGNISEFIRDPHHGIFKICYFYNQWEKAGLKLPYFMEIKYEDMHKDGSNSLLKIHDFINSTPLCVTKLDKALEAGQFDVMKEREQSGFYAANYKGKLTITERLANNPEAAKTRKGKIGGYIDYLSVDDIEYCADIMKKAGHPFAYGINESDPT